MCILVFVKKEKYVVIVLLHVLCSCVMQSKAAFTDWQNLLQGV